MVDIYLDGGLLLDDFAFRAATPFIDAPANQEIVVGVAPKTSSSASDIIASFPFNLMAGEKYIAIANGVLDPSSFAENPDGRSTGFNIWVKAMAREMGTDNNVDFFILHGSSDAPAVNATLRDGTVLAQGFWAVCTGPFLILFFKRGGRAWLDWLAKPFASDSAA